MEIRFTYQNALLTNSKLRAAVTKKVYRNNPIIKRVKYLDPILFWGYYALLATIFHCLIDWRYEFSVYYGNDLMIWGLFALLFGFGIITFYAVCIRPRWLNNAFLKGVHNLLKNETIIALHDNGLFQKNNQNETLFYYSVIKSVEEIEQYLVILLAEVNLIIIPQNAFINAEQRAEFVALLKQKISQNLTAL